MPIVTYWKTDTFVYEGSGIVTGEEILRSGEAFLEPPEGVIPKCQVVNALKVKDVHLNELDLVNISADDLAASRKFPDLKVALVAKEGPVMESFIKYLKVSWAINTTWDIRIFNSMDAARDWLNCVGSTVVSSN
ncbi:MULTISPECIES: hypothetical protein [Flavobacteriaceae]|uniref:hypothetical protein n=1 Tax=Flavobacteriaceae TaxID=49546 RepID=UPI0014923ADC|nr:MULTISPECIES: hypothetical protein [Allomuricauda]MDC6366247.1 hypothetical protein [Muricauda sp. AC10]